MNLWYQKLTKPLFTPPAEYFPIAWGILYTLMGLSFLLIILSPKTKEKDYAVILFIIQLILNLAWSYLFFDMQSINLALADVILLFVFLIPTMYFFFKISKLAGFLLIPYLLQVIFAIYLTTGIRILN